MIERGPAKKLTIYLNESYRIGAKPAYEVILDVLYRRNISGASVFRGIEGYGSGGAIHTAKILELSGSLPVRIEAIDTEQAIDGVLFEITPMVQKGLIEVSDTAVIKAAHR